MKAGEVCAQCKGVCGDLADGREPEEYCDTCYGHLLENMARAQPQSLSPKKESDNG